MPAPLLLAAAAVFPVAALTAVALGVAGAGAGADPGLGCGSGGTGATLSGTALDPEQLANAQTIVATTAGRGLPAYAAIVAVDTSYTESTLHNIATETDHDSEGLFQQRISIYTAAVADDPVRATNAFLDRLVGVPDYLTTSVGVDAQTVQISEHPERYEPNTAMATSLVGQFWPTAHHGIPATTASPATSGSTPEPADGQPTGSAAAQPIPATTGSTTATRQATGEPISTAVAAVCPGGGGAIPVGGGGNNVAGTTTLPAGIVLTGSPAGQQAVTFALAQLGKPYVYGAAGPASWDCSGLTMAAWAAAGVPLGHWTVSQATAGTPEPIDLSQAAGGDLVLIPGSDGTASAPGHVGMVIGYAEIDGTQHLYLVQAPMTGIPVEITDTTEWAGQIVAVRHIQ